jgi:membrane-bound lytic murein transglycosylase D
MRPVLTRFGFFVFVLSVFGCTTTRQTGQNEAIEPIVTAKQDTLKTETVAQVQFLQLTDESETKAEPTEEGQILAKFKDDYSRALRLWFVEQQPESAKVEFDSAVQDLFQLGEGIGKSDIVDESEIFSVSAIREEAELTADVVDVKLDAEEANGETKNGEARMDYYNWLAIGLIENYKSMLEIRGEYDEAVFNQQVVERLSFYGTGLAGLNSYGVIRAPIAKGHALDYIPLETQHERVQKFIDHFRGYGSRTLQHLYQKLGRYEHIVRPILKAEGISEDLIYLAMIESGFSTHAKSRARAVGPWQFVLYTGRRYGLNIDWWVDERRDIYASTQAAARHLKDLFYEYGDWYLAMAAYNSGGGRVNQAIRKNNTRDYWEMTKLPRETKSYVPYIIASATVIKNPAEFGLTLSRDDAWMVDTVTIHECLDLQIIAECALTTTDTIRDINPALLRWCTPPTVLNYLLKVPYGRRQTFLDNYAKVPYEKKRSWVRYQVKYGETLSGIAYKYGTDQKAIMQANQLKSSTNLITGQWLLIPVAPAGYKAPAKEEKKETRSYASNNSNTRSNTAVNTPKKKDEKAGKKKIAYKVVSGNTLGEIAEWYNILAQQIRDWNGLYYGDPIYPGQVLTLWVDPYIPDEGYRHTTQKKSKESETIEPGTKIYVVQDGDTLPSIAKLFNVEVSSIKRWNRMASNTVRVGEKLKIVVGGK